MSPLTAASASALTQAHLAERVQTAVLKKSHDAAKAEGAAVVKLIEAAASFAPGGVDVKA
ncbi:YjfB family protein [Phycisphaera mikurensis]|uniref:Uncharacterized protein n=1 Tax=Phycisphaera mikurensis (strain NBRC 102666 / KCTC 22515 / FYK2301M01) TaxID=1142394 RepID=I0IHP6_PHYMF|nr:YjfB family protein [Phycisphaera mikurensis]MBB6441029.1 hypothetical protein [Phycisphaera mikurensis]BAM04784.1 hypothetical protein PSMK_26250 [Phycisphaera mikurensis NBRC 102666]